MASNNPQPNVNYDEIPNFTNADGKKIYCKYWSPTSAEVDTPDARTGVAGLAPCCPRALVFVAHGVGEHCEWYDTMAEPLQKENILVFSHDHVGHGKSEGSRVHIKDIQVYIRDMFQHVTMVKESHPDCPFYIIGHSMGGTIAIKAALDKPELVSGLILIGPAIVRNPESASMWKVAAAKVMAAVYPEYQVGNIDPKWLSHDDNIVKRYQTDPLVWHGGLKAGWAVAMLAVFNVVQSRIREVTCPLLIFHGDQDKLCEVSGSQLMYDSVASKDKCLKIIPGAFHQVHNESGEQGEQVRRDIVEWIKARL